MIYRCCVYESCPVPLIMTCKRALNNHKHTLIHIHTRDTHISVLTSAAEGFVDELGRRIEVDAHVEGGRVVSLDAVVGDVHAGVVLGPTAPLALGAVEDVRDAKFRQLPTIRCDIPAGGGELHI